MHDGRGLQGAAAAVAVLTLALSAATSCGDDESTIPAAGGGGSTATTGGAGNAPDGCEDCVGSTPICLDGEACVSTCPVGRNVCHPDEPGPSSCCETGEQCCRAQDTGLPADICAPASEGCPV